MDTNILTGIFGLVGSLIGGAASYYGSKQAARISIESQERVNSQMVENERIKQQEKVRIYARIAFQEIFTALHESFRVIKKEPDEAGNYYPIFSIHPQYGDVITILSEYISGEDLIKLNKIYGIIKKLQYSVFDRNEAGVLIDSRLLAFEVYTIDTAEKILRFPFEQITLDYIKDKIPIQFRSLFNMLNILADLNDPIINNFGCRKL